VLHQLYEPARVWPHRRHREQDVLPAGRSGHLRFRNRGALELHNPQRQLRLHQLWKLVRFHMCTQPPHIAGNGDHAPQILLHSIHVDEQRR
jgi:hypothetical protein